MGTSSLIKVCAAATLEERRKGIDYIENNMRSVFGCEPPPTAGLVLLAYCDDEIVGSIVMRDVVSKDSFSLEQRYELSRSNPLTRPRSMIIEGSRWISTHPSASLSLLKSAAAISLEFGKQYMLFEAKDYSATRLQQLGATIIRIPDAKLSIEKTRKVVPEDGMRYFLENPAPSLYLFEMISVLK